MFEIPIGSTELFSDKIDQISGQVEKLVIAPGKKYYRIFVEKNGRKNMIQLSKYTFIDELRKRKLKNKDILKKFNLYNLVVSGLPYPKESGTPIKKDGEIFIVHYKHDIYLFTEKAGIDTEIKYYLHIEDRNLIYYKTISKINSLENRTEKIEQVDKKLILNSINKIENTKALDILKKAR